jgi:hypothetical protein
VEVEIINFIHFQSEFNFKFKYARDCLGSDNVIKHINSSIILTDECDVVLSSCAFVQPYKSGVVRGVARSAIIKHLTALATYFLDKIGFAEKWIEGL